MRRWGVTCIVTLVVAFLAFRYYLIHRGVDLPVNNVDPAWRSGSLLHLLPTVSENRILIKASFKEPLSETPKLSVAGSSYDGVRTDTRGYFWYFDAPGLTPDTEYELIIRNARGEALCDPWPLKTFPAPYARPEHFRVLIYTGLGGHDVHREWFGTGPLPLEIRIKLLRKALSFKPDALISSGDQIYYDLLYDKSSRVMGGSPRSIAFAGEFDRSKPVLGTENEEVLKKAVGPQIANLYGTACRSIPTFFLLDDHDYFENDIATEKDGFDIKLLLLAWRSPFFKGGVSFPPDNFMLDLARTAQKLYLPEFLPDANRPRDLPGSNAPDRPAGVSECYGTLRYGDLVEALLYEARRFVTLTGRDAVMVHPKAEKWLVDRMRAEEAIHVVNVPAVVFGWSAGKWMEWYPDVLGKDGKLTTSLPKYKWQEGWFAQHDRILKAASEMRASIPLFICGDLHSQADGKILRSRTLDLSANPVNVVVTGSLGTGKRGWPSDFRGVAAQVPSDLLMEVGAPCLEKNGFVIVDFTREKIIVRFFAWKPPEPVEAIDRLEAHRVLELRRPAKRD